MKFNKKWIWSLILILVLVGGYYGYQMYMFSEGVVEDAKRLENFERPKELKLTDSTTMILKEVNQDSLELE